MAQARIRRSRTTLLDQISVMEPTNLRDFLNIREEDDFPAAAGGRRGGGTVTLASILESEKRGQRRLLDILREEGESSGTPPEATEERAIRVPLMTLMGLTEETGGHDTITAAAAAAAGEAVAEEMVCCVCLVRKRGAAFIPCGHTYCRVCSRELWSGRRNCPLCNGPVVDILDIF